MKKYISLLLVLVMLLSAAMALQACKPKNNTSDNTTGQQTDPTGTAGNTQPTQTATQPADDEDEWSSETDTEWVEDSVIVIPTNPTNPTDGTNPATKPTAGTEPSTTPTQTPTTTNPTEEWYEDEWSSESDIEWSE